MSSPKFQNGDIAYLTWSPVPHRVLNTTTWVRDSGTVIEYGLVRPALGPDEPLDRSAEFPSLQELQSWPEDKLHRTRLAETSLLTVEEKVWASLQPLLDDAVYRPVLKSVFQKVLQEDSGLKYGDRVRLRGTKREGFIVDGWHEAWDRGSCWVTHVVFDDGGEEHRMCGDLEIVPGEEQGDPPPVLLRHCSPYTQGARVWDEGRKMSGTVTSEEWAYHPEYRERIFSVTFSSGDVWTYTAEDLHRLKKEEEK